MFQFEPKLEANDAVNLSGVTIFSGYNSNISKILWSTRSAQDQSLGFWPDEFPVFLSHQQTRSIRPWANKPDNWALQETHFHPKSKWKENEYNCEKIKRLNSLRILEELLFLKTVRLIGCCINSLDIDVVHSLGSNLLRVYKSYRFFLVSIASLTFRSNTFLSCTLKLMRPKCLWFKFSLFL